MKKSSPFGFWPLFFGACRWPQRVFPCGFRILAAWLTALVAIQKSDGATTDGALRMEVITAYNFVVDSNVETPAGKSPSAAHLGVKIYNDGPVALTDVDVRIGDLLDPGTSVGTPGVFPSRTVTVSGSGGYSGTFALQMPGGAADAARRISRIEPGTSVTQYFFVTYPLKDGAGNSVAGAAPDPSDDLWLQYDIWASAKEGSDTRRVDQTTKVTMRNEISAMANKIWPNTSSKVPDHYLDAIEVSLGWRPDTDSPRLGTGVRLEGIWYDLGNVGAGFDNNGDGVPDRNAWMQPVGDPSQFDPMATRLVKCYGLVIVKRNDGTELLIPFEDRLYFENLPENNTGAVGLVYYEFLPLAATGPTTLTPYQEVASGYDNEKFNSDYGTSGGSFTTGEPEVSLDKNGPVFVQGGDTATYTMTATNGGTVGLGFPLMAVPFTFEDNVPDALVYVAGSATAANTLAPGQTVAVSWSTDDGATWLETEPPAASVTSIRWTLGSTLAAGTSATVSFQASVPPVYPQAIIENTAVIKLGSAGELGRDKHTTLVTGINSIGDLVWKDDDRDSIKDAGESGIANAGVALYHDANSNGILDGGDPLYATTQTNASGIYSFANLPDGKFLVVVDTADTDLPVGYSLPNSATDTIAVDLDSPRTNVNPVAVLTVDWPFIGALEVVKSVSPTTYGEGDLITYTIDVENHSTPVAAKTVPVQTAWAATVTGNRSQQNATNSQGAPDNVYGRIDWAANADNLAGSSFSYPDPSGGITKVELVFNAYLPSALTNDTLEVEVNGSLFTTLSATQLNTLVGSAKEYVIDVTSLNAPWSWPQVQALTGNLVAKKISNADGPILWVDAVGFRVTTNAVPPAPGSYGPTTINPLPLVDSYDPAKLQYVSASTAPSSVSPGTITWNNLGPLNAGARKSITVTFRALAPPDTNGNGEPDTTTHINIASSSGAKFVSGRPVNPDSSTATVTIQPRGEIGDLVFWDINGNSVRDVGEPGLANVLVTLSNGAQTRTDSSGYYLFPSLVDGTYTVTVDTGTLPWSTFNQTKDPDATVNNASTVTINNNDGNPANDFHFDRDFGYDSTVNVISGALFTDNDGDGSPDAGEAWLTGTIVTLLRDADSNGSYETTVTSTVTNAIGFYQFTSLPNGLYRMVVSQPAGTVQTLDPDLVPGNTSGDNATNENASGGNLYPNNDFAYRPTGALALGDTLYLDWNGDGDQDAGEDGIANVDVFLYEDSNGNGLVDPADDALVATSVTNAAGTYGFINLPAGNWIVVVNTADSHFPESVTQTQDFDGMPDSRAVVNLSSTRLDLDFGYEPQGTGRIGDTVFIDQDGDGLADAGEPGITGVGVSLYEDTDNNGTIDANDALVATTVTGANGLYLFTGLPAGNYLVDVDQNAASIPEDSLGNTYRRTNSDPRDVTLAAGQSLLTADFGFAAPVSIGDFVFYDTNANGNQDWSETGISGVTVELYQDADLDGLPDSGTPLATTVTADGSGVYPAGFYQFGNLPAGTFYVRVVTSTLPQSGGQPIPQTADPDRDGIPVADNAYPGMPPGDDADSMITLALGSNYSGADFGYQPAGAIGDFVWLDIDQDGVQDAGEPGVSGVTVRITNGSTTVDAVTDFDGYWSVANLTDGSWTVSVPAANFGSGAPLENTAATHDADGGNNSSVQIVISGGDVNLPVGNLGLDFGYKLGGAFGISGTVAIHDSGVIGTADDIDDFYDDGIDQDAGPDDETELAGLTIYLTTAAGNLLGSTVTDSNGDYSFAGLPAGGYRVILGTTTPPLNQASLTTTSANNPAVSSVTSPGGTSVIQTVTLASGSVDNVDFTFLSDTVLDFGDLPSSYGMTTLAQHGARHAEPSGGFTRWLGTAPDADTNGIANSLASGDDVFGDDEDGITPVAPAAWADGLFSNGDGGSVQAHVHGGGWLVAWIDWNQDGDFLDAKEMIADQAVAAGTVTIGFDIPAGTIQAAAQSWLSRFRLFTSRPAFPLFSYGGETADGEVEDHLLEKSLGALLGDIVWIDTDGDGVFDASESGLPGRIVELRDGSNIPIALQTTGNGTQDVDGDGIVDPVGYYRFRALNAGIYNVTVTNPPAGYDPSYDENGTGTPSTTSLVLANDEQHLTADFGYEPMRASISGQVRHDVDSDGDLGDSDPAAGFVKIQLWTDPNGDGNPSDGVQVGETYTDSSGNYLFADVPTGSYVVVEINHPASTSTADIDGGNHDRIAVSLAGVNITGRDFLDTIPPLYLVSGHVFRDGQPANDNVPGSDDTPVSGVVVELFFDRDGSSDVSAGDPLLAQTLTNHAGYYQFEGVASGRYIVREIDLPSAVSEWDAEGSLTDNVIPLTVLNSDVTARDFLDDGPFLGSISGTVLADVDGDNDGDAPIQNVTLNLLDSLGNPVLDGFGQPVTTTTDSNGDYSFGGLSPGDYCVVQDQPSGFASVSDADGPNDNIIGSVTAISVTAGQNNGGNDFVETQFGSVSGYVRRDDDNNGSGDTGLGGVVLNLLDSSGNPALDGFGVPIQVATNVSGFYQFTLVPAGSYRVSQNQPPGYASVSDVDGANNNLIGDETPIAIVPGLAVTNRDFVEIQFGAISGRVFKDTNDDGTGDTLFPGVTVALLDGAGDPVDGDPNTPGVQPWTLITGVDGSYRFPGLLPGNYQVSETQPSGYGSVSDVDGGNPDIIGNVTPITVNPGQEVIERDFVEIELGTISGYVFVGSTPLGGVTLTLLDENGDPVDGDPNTPGVQPITTVTNGSGYYQFTGVRPGIYQVGQTQPFGYDSFGDVDGGDIDIIGDVTPITLSPGQHSENNNFIETLDTCPDDWAHWKFLHPSETPSGNPDQDAYDNFAEFAFAMPYDNGTGSPWLGHTAWIIRPSTLAPGTLEGVFIRHKGASLNVTYALQYAAAPGNPTVWQEVALTPLMYSTADNGDCTETVTIHDLETLTGLTGGKGTVRIRVDLDDDGGNDEVDHTSFTETEGWTETPLVLCCRTYNNPYQRESAFTGTVSGVSGQDILFTGQTLDGLIAPGVSYYVEVTSGENEGHRFDVTASAGESLTLANDPDIHAATAPFNTLAGAPPVSLAGDTVILRRHWTLAEMFPPSAFGATGVPTTADEVQLYVDGGWMLFWNYDDGGNHRWVRSGSGFADQGGAVIPPGWGSFFNNRTAVTSLLAYGEVRANDFRRPLDTGNNLVGGGYPLDQSAAGTNGRAMTLAAGFFGSRDFKTADTIFLWNKDANAAASGYGTYFLLNGAPVFPDLLNWAKVGDNTAASRDAEVLLLENRAVFVRSKNGLDPYTSPAPWAP